MGKKSVVDSKHLPTEDESTMKAVEAALNARQVEPEDVFQEMLRVALQTHLDTRHNRPDVPVRTDTGPSVYLKLSDINYKI